MTKADWNKIASDYQDMLGEVPGHVGLKQMLHDEGTEGETTILLIERARAAALDSSDLPSTTVQLLQFAICAVLHMGEGARIHAAAARRQGVTVTELLAAARVAWVIAGGAALNTALVGISASEGEQ